MNKTGQYIIFCFLLLVTILFGNKLKAQEQVTLFPDKSYAVSGDTIWFTILIHSENQENISQVVHVQLDDIKNNHILKVPVLCNGAFGQGYIPVPDSLSTGLYVLNSFTLAQKNSEMAVINQKFINVYNRFEGNIPIVYEPSGISFKTYNQENGFEIKTDKESYRRGEKVQVSLTAPDGVSEKYKKVIITAGVADPLSEKYFSSYSEVQYAGGGEKNKISLVEKDGILVSGKVTQRETGAGVHNAIVLLSIPDSVPFFDYCVSDEEGKFYFYLRNATGTADLILQSVTKDNRNCEIELTESFIDIQGNNETERILTPDEEKFIVNILKASYFDKLFGGYSVTSSDYFSKPMQFDYPFYGEPTKTYDPNLFIDLPDFQEIAREILHGVQYRERRDEITIRLLDNGAETVFDKEPLRLLDGIPFFNNEVFKPMTTDDISKVDVVFYERFYGDLSFNGVLSVYTKNRSLDWIDRDPGIGHFKYACLQPPCGLGFINNVVPNTNVPNLNKVLYRNMVNNLEANRQFGFYTSDVGGNVEVRLVLIDKNNQVSYCHKLIKVE